MINKENNKIKTEEKAPKDTRNLTQKTDFQELNSSQKHEKEVTPLFFKRRKMRLNKKLKVTLIRINDQKTQNKRDQILTTRREKLQKFKIDYIPLCADEDWEAMAEFYVKNSKK